MSITEFVNYFNEQLKITPVPFNIDKVYTLGSVHVISHKSMIYVDNKFGDSIVNVIDPIDPIPVMMAGNKNEPKNPLHASKKLGISRFAINAYGKALFDNFYKIASFGPIGQFLVFVDNELRVLHRKDDDHGLFHQHLVFGATTYFKTKKWSDIPTLMKLRRHHLYERYKENLDYILKRYIHKDQQ